MAIQKKAQSQQSISVPSLDEVSPAYAGLIAKRLDLDARKSVLERQIEELRSGKVPQSLVKAATDRALALVGDDVPSGDFSIRPSPEDIQSLVAEQNAELRSIEGAISIVDAKLPAASQEASKKVCESVRSAYFAALREVALAVVPAVTAHREYLRLVEELNVGDVRWQAYLPQPASLRRAFGNFSQTDQAILNFLSDLVAAGIITNEETKNG